MNDQEAAIVFVILGIQVVLVLAIVGAVVFG